MLLNVPTQDIDYVPGFWQVLKTAWVKYCASFIFFYVLLRHWFLKYLLTSGAFDVVSISQVHIHHHEQ